jgi:hypothetical protein
MASKTKTYSRCGQRQVDAFYRQAGSAQGRRGRDADPRVVRANDGETIPTKVSFPQVRTRFRSALFRAHTPVSRWSGGVATKAQPQLRNPIVDGDYCIKSWRNYRLLRLLDEINALFRRRISRLRSDPDNLA